MIVLALVLVTQQLPVQNFPPIDHPGADPVLAADIRSLCPASANADRDALFKLELQQEEFDRLKAGGAKAWAALGCTRALLAAKGALSHDGTAMIGGDSWAQGALKALLQALALRPDDARSADLLATLAMDDEEPRDIDDAVTALDRAVSLGISGSATLRGCADLALRAHRPQITLRCATRGLASGTDSTWHLLLLARLRFREADSVGGSQQFIRAAGAVRDTFARLDVAWHLQWFLSPEEQKEWMALQDSSRSGWMRDHLALRDVRDGQPPGARLAEHFRRLEYVEESFRLKVPKMMHTAMLSRPSSGIVPPGPPATKNGFATPLTSQGGSGASSLLDVSFRDYVRWQVEWDDRGIIWMRYGEPRLRFTYNNPMEIWRYDIDGQELLLTFVGEDFDGSAAATRLIIGRFGGQYCGIDAWRCSLVVPPPEVVERVRQQDREYISGATTNDDNSVRVADAIEVISRLHRLWDPISAAPLALLTYAVKAKDLASQQDSAARTTRVEFEFRRWDESRNLWQDTSFYRRFTYSVKGIQRLTGFLLTSSTPTVSSWSLVASQSDHRRGRAWDLTTGPLDSGPIALSDLVLGQEGQGIVWSNHNTDVLLAPLNAVDRKLPVSLYYQIRAAEARTGVRTAVALYRVVGGVARDTAAFQVAFDQAVRAGINEVAPTLDVTRLDSGDYRLEVRVTDERGMLLTRRTVVLTLE